MANLASDNTAPVHPAIMAALQTANSGHAKAYGSDALTEKLTGDFRRLFDHSTLEVFPVFNGSAANCVALAALMRSFEAVVAHEDSHLETDECGMPEFFTGGKMLTLPGVAGKLQPGGVAKLLDLAESGGVHHVRPRVISVAQSTEFGAVYRPEEIAALAAVAKAGGCFLHMDGARFANAVAALGMPPAEATWRAGVDVLSFGGTKNGAMLAEAVVFFDPALARDVGFVRKRAGQLASKQRYISAQLSALVEDGLWLRNAGQANAMARRLADGIGETIFPVEANAVFVRIDKARADALLARGHYFYDWPALGEGAYRLLMGFGTTAAEVDGFLADWREGARA